MPKNATVLFVSAVLAGVTSVSWTNAAAAASCRNLRVSEGTEVIHHDESNAAAFKRFAKQFATTSKELAKLEGQFDKLCNYGRTTGTSRFEHIIAEMTEVNKSCGDPITRAALLSNKQNFIDNKFAVASDCRTAESLSRPPQTAIDYVARGKAFVEKHDTNRAISDFSEAIRLDANLATAFYRRGGILHDQGDTKGALSDMLDAFRLDSQYGGSDYFADGTNDRKIADLIAIANETIADDASFGGAYTLRSALLFQRGDYDSAIRDATEAIRLNSRDSSALNNRAIARLKKGDIDGAIEDLDEAILLIPNSPFLFRNRGRAYMQRDDVARALADLNEAIRLGPKHQPAFAYRGQIYEKMDRRDDAIADYQTVLFLDGSEFKNVGLEAYLIAGKRLLMLLGEDRAVK